MSEKVKEIMSIGVVGMLLTLTILACIACCAYDITWHSLTHGTATGERCEKCTAIVEVFEGYEENERFN